MRAPWDLVVLGGGTAGIVGAKNAASFGARVLLIESERTGGDCLWTGCVPSKSLLAAAHAAAVGRTSATFGVTYGEPSVDFAAVMEH
ncbi:MAG: FAD-dependent oxidoreductase, partial [Ornithinimicrobium sp.]